MPLILSISVGAIIGALSRHFMMNAVGKWLGTGFPWGTVLINMLGSFIMGVLIETFALKWSASQEVRAMLTVGILGSFTTFSTFSLDFALLTERGQLAYAFGYAALSVLAAITALFGGLYLVRTLLG